MVKEPNTSWPSKFLVRDDNAAFEIAEKVAASQLVKTAITGSDPNWDTVSAALRQSVH